MRRSTAAAVGTLTGAALIVGVRLSVSAPETPLAAAPAAEQAPAADKPPASGGKAGSSPDDKSATKPSKKPEEKKEEEPQGKFKDGTYEGKAKYVYGTIEVSLKVTNGNISAVQVGYPTGSDSGQINPPAVAKLKQETLKEQSAEVDAVSGATLTSDAYVKSLQAALDKAA